MTPHLGDTIINRYTLVAPLREAPGLSAWKANDRIWSRDCLLYIVTDRTAISEIDSTASALATSRDARFSRVLQLQKHDGVAVVITEPDAGLSLSTYMRGPAGKILSFEAMRSIIAQTSAAIRDLMRQSVVYHAISTESVRISVDGVQLAATPLSDMMADVSVQDHAGDAVHAYDGYGAPESGGLPVEVMAIRQLAALLYAMVTHTPSASLHGFDPSALDADMPMEFKLICKRGLGLYAEGERPVVPMSSLAELDALLGDFKPLNALAEHDIALPSISGPSSIADIALRGVDADDILDIPSDIVFAGPLPAMVTDLPKYSTALDSDEVVDVTPLTGDLFSGFDFAKNTSGSNRTVPLNVSTIRRASAPIDANTDQLQAGAILDPNPSVPMPMTEPSTGTIPPIPSDMGPAYDDQASEGMSDATRITDDDALEDGDDDAKDANPPLLSKMPAKVISVIIGVAILAVAGGFAIHGLSADSGADHTVKTSDPWSDSDLNDVPFGDSPRKGAGNNADGATPQNGHDTAGSNADTHSGSDTGSNSGTKGNGSSNGTKGTTAGRHAKTSKSVVSHGDKNAKRVPQPKHPVYENSNPLPVASTQFLTNPGGQSGYAYHIHLQQPHDTYRIIVRITTSGGRGYIRTNTTGDPSQGEQVAEFSFDASGTTEVKFTKVSQTQDLIMWVPMDSLPNHQLYIQSLQVF